MHNLKYVYRKMETYILSKIYKNNSSQERKGKKEFFNKKEDKKTHLVCVEFPGQVYKQNIK